MNLYFTLVIIASALIAACSCVNWSTRSAFSKAFKKNRRIVFVVGRSTKPNWEKPLHGTFKMDPIWVPKLVDKFLLTEQQYQEGWLPEKGTPLEFMTVGLSYFSRLVSGKEPDAGTAKIALQAMYRSYKHTHPKKSTSVFQFSRFRSKLKRLAETDKERLDLLDVNNIDLKFNMKLWSHLLADVEQRSGSLEKGSMFGKQWKKLLKMAEKDFDCDEKCFKSGGKLCR